MVQQPLMGQGVLNIRASRSHSDIPHSVGLLGLSDQPDAETSTLQHTTFTTDIIHAPNVIRIHNPSKRAAADPPLRPRGHWDRLPSAVTIQNAVFTKSNTCLRGAAAMLSLSVSKNILKSTFSTRSTVADNYFVT
jgi:hypothetical protein